MVTASSPSASARATAAAVIASRLKEGLRPLPDGRGFSQSCWGSTPAVPAP